MDSPATASRSAALPAATHPAARGTSSLRAVNLGLFTNALLALAKVAAGTLGASPALLADGINSVSDVAYYVVVRVLLVFAAKPADDEHPYGHERLESIGAVVVGSFVMITGLAVVAAGANRVAELLAGEDGYGGAAAITFWVALATIVTKLVLYSVTRAIGRSTSNPAVDALALDHRNDVLAAAAAAIGIWFGRHGHPWVDPAAGGLVGLVILRTGVEILRESSDDLMGSQPGLELRERVRGWLTEVDGVWAVEQLAAHKFGPWVVLTVTIGVDGTIPVAQGDAIADAVEHVLFERMDFLRAVHVHYHPAGARGPSDRRLGGAFHPAAGD